MNFADPKISNPRRLRRYGITVVPVGEQRGFSQDSPGDCSLKHSRLPIAVKTDEVNLPFQHQINVVHPIISVEKVPPFRHPFLFDRFSKQVIK